MKFRVEVQRVEHQVAFVEVEAGTPESAKAMVEEEGVDSDLFDCVSATETVILPTQYSLVSFL